LSSCTALGLCIPTILTTANKTLCLATALFIWLRKAHVVKQLLEQLGVKFELLLPDANEDAEALETVFPHENHARMYNASPL